MVSIPARGGSFTEGELGTPRFINPLLAASDPDRDLVALVYSGLLRVGPNGNLIPDLADTYTVSEDGLTYTFVLKENLRWHDGEPITSDDVAFTIEMVQNELAKSPRRAHWEGVSVETLDEKTVAFTLKQPYAPFLENTTLGILPRHLWQNVPVDQFSFSSLNLEAIGSGPYKISSLKKDKDGVPQEATLTAFSGFALGQPLISKIILKFFLNSEDLFESYRKGTVDSIAAISPASVAELKIEETQLGQAVLPRVFGVFFNQNEAAVFSNIEVRKALNVATDRERIIREVLLGYGASLEGPLSPGSVGYTRVAPAELTELDTRIQGGENPTTARVALAREILTRNGWKLNETTGLYEKKKGQNTETLSFSISTGNAPELKRVAEILKEEWGEVGARVELKFFEIADLNQNVIRPRKYDALLFGQIVGRYPDPYAFWHSSQRLDPGLNVALYTNASIDSTLEAARVSSDDEKRASELSKFQGNLVKDTPAVFLYAPTFLYAMPKEAHNFTLSSIGNPSERFSNIYKAHIYTENVWKIFNRNTTN